MHIKKYILITLSLFAFFSGPAVSVPVYVDGQNIQGNHTIEFEYGSVELNGGSILKTVNGGMDVYGNPSASILLRPDLTIVNTSEIVFRLDDGDLIGPDSYAHYNYHDFWDFWSWNLFYAVGIDYHDIFMDYLQSDWAEGRDGYIGVKMMAPPDYSNFPDFYFFTDYAERQDYYYAWIHIKIESGLITLLGYAYETNPNTSIATTPFISTVDSDADGIANDIDNCTLSSNTDQSDADNDGTGDACDTDFDNDKVLNDKDNCPLIANLHQIDSDLDGMGDVCDLNIDTDNDSVPDNVDNCPLVMNMDQNDIDLDGIGDACDPDIDNDGVFNGSDNCPLIANSQQIDLDNDGIGDACDPFIATADISVSASATPDPVKKGAKLSYNITVSSLGTIAADSVSLINKFTQNVRIVTIASSQGSCAKFGPKDASVSCNFGSLPAGATVTVNLEVKPLVVGDFINTVVVSTGSDDADLTNNTVTVSTGVYK